MCDVLPQVDVVREVTCTDSILQIILEGGPKSQDIIADVVYG